MILNVFFEKVYVINLDRRIDRWKRMKQRLCQLSINAKRISAVDFWDIDESKGTPKQRARYACTESHYKVISEALKNKYRSILILEDDAVFVSDFSQIIENYIREVPGDWDMVMLGYYPGSNFPKEKLKGKKVFKIPQNKTKHDGLWASHAYGVKNTIYKEILSKKNGAFSKYPHKKDSEGYGCIDFTYYYDFHGKRNCYAVNPSLIMQEKVDTDVDLKTEKTRVY